MPTASPSPTAEPKSESFGLFSLDAHTARRVRLPLKAVDARFEVAGDCASVTLEQLYELDGPNPVEVIYTFPLPPLAAVHACELRVGERVVRACARALEQARHDYQRAKAAGHRAALVETLRENLFELRLGNVQPGDAIQLRLSYVQPLSGAGSARSLRLPTCPGVRYVPGRPVGADGGTDLVPDAGRLNPPRIAAGDRDAALFFCAGTLRHVSQIESETHDLEIGATSPDGVVSVMLRHDTEVPDRDLVLAWQADADPAALVSADAPDHLVCSVLAPDDMPTTRGARDIFFLIDASGSMEGANWVAVISAMRLALAELAPGDRVSVDLFSNAMEPITSGRVPADATWRRAILTALQGHQPGGGTEFSSAFATIVATAAQAERPVVVVITDGQFGDEERACAVAASSRVEVHTIGIDANVNEAVLSKIARRTRGTCSLCSPHGDLEATVRRIVRDLLAPALERITVDGPWDLVGNPPALRRGHSALIPFRRRDARPDARPPKTPKAPTSVQVTLEFSDASQRHLELPVHATRGTAPSLLAAKAELTALLDANRRDEAVALACRHNLLCEGVAFVAVDEAETVLASNAVLVQPAIEEPALTMSYSRVVLASPVVAESEVFCRSEPEHLHRILLRKSGVHAKPAPRQKKSMLGWVRNPFAKADSNAGPDEGIEIDPPAPTADGIDACRQRAAALTCFADATAWMSLVDTQLLPWARQRKAHLRLLQRLLDDLAPLADDSDGRLQIHFLLRQLRGFLDAATASAVDAFLKQIPTG